MFGLKKNYNTIIMDGSDPSKNGKIIGMIGALAYPKGNGKFNFRPLDERHPNMYVVEYRTTEKCFRNIEAFLEQNYSGLCIILPHKIERRDIDMGRFNEAQIRAMETGIYICRECGAIMELDDFGTLECPECGFSEDIDHYGWSDEDYDALYPTREEICGDDEEDDDNDYGESYEEVYGELSHDD